MQKETETKKAKSADKPEAAATYKTLVIHTAKYKTLLTSKYENRVQYKAPDPKKIFSFIPGTINKLTVKPGQKAKKGELMLVLEAMKMENRITFPFDGVIGKVNIKVGERIPKGFLMVEYESIKLPS